MKKMIRSTFITFCFLLMISITVRAQFRDDVQAVPDSISLTMQELVNPSFHTFSPLQNPAGISQSGNIKFSNTTKFFMKLGTNILRGDNEKHALYSLENGWKYPGPTIRYPESASEYNSFLRRYELFSPDSK